MDKPCPVLRRAPPAAVHCWKVFAKRLGCEADDEPQVGAGPLALRMAGWLASCLRALGKPGGCSRHSTWHAFALLTHTEPRLPPVAAFAQLPTACCTALPLGPPWMQASALLGDSLQRLHSLAVGQEHQQLWFMHPPSILVGAGTGRAARALRLAPACLPQTAQLGHHLFSWRRLPHMQPGQERAPSASPIETQACPVPDVALPLPAAPGLQTAAVVLVARKERGLVPAWPTPLQQLTGLKEDLHPEASPAHSMPAGGGRICHTWWLTGVDLFDGL